MNSLTDSDGHIQVLILFANDIHTYVTDNRKVHLQMNHKTLQFLLHGMHKHFSCMIYHSLHHKQH